MGKLQNKKQDIRNWWEAEKQRFLTCLIAVFVWGMAAHAWAFFHAAFSHDSLTEFNAAVYGNEWKMQLGRIFVPAFRFLFRGNLNLPWLIGMLALIFIALSVYLMADMFAIRSYPALILLAGVCTVNQTVTAAAGSFINDLDSNMMALLFSVLAAWFYRRNRKGDLVWGAICLMFSMGLYQSYISVTIALMIFLLLGDLVRKEKISNVWKRGWQAIGILLCAGILYYAAMKLILFVTHIEVEKDSYNSALGFLNLEAVEILKLLGLAWVRTGYNLLVTKLSYPQLITAGARVVTFLLAGGVLIRQMMKRKCLWSHYLSVVALVLILPLGMDVCYVLNNGYGHDLMNYAFWLSDLFFLWIFESQAAYNGQESLSHPAVGSGETKDPVHWVRTVYAAIILVFLLGGIRSANALYLKKEMEHEANMAYFNNVVVQMEQVEGYKHGVTPVVMMEKDIDGLVEPEGFEQEKKITGAWSVFFTPGFSRDAYQALFSYVLYNPAVMADEETWESIQLDPRVTDMPNYPDEGCMAMVDGVLVVKFGGRHR